MGERLLHGMRFEYIQGDIANQSDMAAVVNAAKCRAAHRRRGGRGVPRERGWKMNAGRWRRFARGRG